MDQILSEEHSMYDLNSSIELNIKPENMGILTNRAKSVDIQQGCKFVNEHVMQCTNNKNTSFANPIKKLVSKQKNRFNLDGFNLDLTYITDQIIAMGFPAEDLESLFRNSMQDVQRFFNQRHKDHYRIINLCSERKYNHSYFNGNVSEYPFDDHQAPTFALIYGMCEELEDWLGRDKLNVAGIHCKAGKGRTGIMICCYLLYCGKFSNSYDAMRYYGYMRTKNRKGVTIPSQIRYVIYFEKAIKGNMRLIDIPGNKIRIVSMKMVTIPRMNFNNSCDPWLVIQNENKEFIIDRLECRTFREDVIIFDMGIYAMGDVRVICYNRSVMSKKGKMFQFWFNTSFLDQSGVLIIDKFMLDGAVKDKKHKIYSTNFRVELLALNHVDG